MGERPGFTVSTKGTGPRITFGPSRMGLWPRFESVITYTDQPLRVTISAEFDGDKVQAKVVGIERTDGAGVTPRDLTRLQLGAAISQATMGALSPDDGAHVGKRPGRRRTDEELRLVADVYWFNHVTGGNPRQAIRAIWGLERSTADGWIAAAAKLYGLPGRPAEGQEA